MNNNIFLAVILSFGILLGFQHFYVKPHQQALHIRYLEHKVAATDTKDTAPIQTGAALRDRADILKESPRLSIETPELSGSINLKGALIDDLSLVNYRQTQDPDSPSIILLSPSGSSKPHAAYYAQFNWLAESSSVAVPGAETLWKADSPKLTPGQPVRLTWDNGQGLVFQRTIAVDREAMFTITDRVTNKNEAPLTLYPFGIVA